MCEFYLFIYIYYIYAFMGIYNMCVFFVFIYIYMYIIKYIFYIEKIKKNNKLPKQQYFPK